LEIERENITAARSKHPLVEWGREGQHGMAEDKPRGTLMAGFGRGRLGGKGEKDDCSAKIVEKYNAAKTSNHANHARLNVPFIAMRFLTVKGIRSDA
jgi:hypothetical protein